jgi:hypothetical protein
MAATLQAAIRYASASLQRSDPRYTQAVTADVAAAHGRIARDTIPIRGERIAGGNG